MRPIRNFFNGLKTICGLLLLVWKVNSRLKRGRDLKQYKERTPQEIEEMDKIIEEEIVQVINQFIRRSGIYDIELTSAAEKEMNQVLKQLVCKSGLSICFQHKPPELLIDAKRNRLEKCPKCGNVPDLAS